MKAIETFMENKRAADEKWRTNGNLGTINTIRTMVTVLLIGGLATIYFSFRSGGTSVLWLTATVAIFAALTIIHFKFEKLVSIRKANEKIRNSSINSN